MPNFKPKTNKKIEIDEKTIITVDSKHEELMNDFSKDEDTIKELRAELKQLKSVIKENAFENIDEKLEHMDRVRTIKQQIKKMKNRRKEYLLDNAKYIFEYFEDKKNISKNNNKKKVLNNFFNIEKKVEVEDTKLTNTKMYLINVDDQFLDIKDFVEEHDRCDNCGGELVHIDYDGIVVCKKCSKQKQYLVEHEKPSYKDPPNEICFYAYRRINHFREILAQYQAKESTVIEETVLDDIKKQIRKEKIDLSELTNDKMKCILKQLGKSKYYEHIPFIKDKLGIKPPTMSIELENKLCNLFIEIQRPYAKYCPNDRVNFMNYYYVLYKLCELLEEDKYLDELYMLKDPVKRMEQDEIWKKICADLEWQFIPTL